jgi:hypothetical protein
MTKVLAYGFEAANAQNLVCADQVCNVELTGAYRHSDIIPAGQPGEGRKASASKRLIFPVNTVNADPCDAQKSGEAVESHSKAA